jgi:dihydroorotate dehydrogenase (NAD+) catalytic subunit
MGGIVGPEQAIEFLIAGASAVDVGNREFIDPTTPMRVLLRASRRICAGTA